MMKISLTSAQREALAAKLSHDEDAQLEGDSYVLDLYDAETPMSIELQLIKDGVEVLAALSLQYDEELDGWYPGEKIKDAALLAALLSSYMGA